jgi:hypothetical protein
LIALDAARASSPSRAGYRRHPAVRSGEPALEDPGDRQEGHCLPRPEHLRGDGAPVPPLGDPRRRRKPHTPSERWSTFIRNHANALLACDLAVTRTLWGGTLYVLVVMEIGSRRILQTNVSAHPSAAWSVHVVRSDTVDKPLLTRHRRRSTPLGFHGQ